MYRKLSHWELYKDIPCKVLLIHLLLNTAYEDYETEDGFTVHRGYCLTSIRQLSEETGLSVREVRTALDKLEATQTLTRTATHKSTLIKLEKWAFYQAEPPKATQFATQTATQFKYNNNKYNNNIYNFPPNQRSRNTFLNYTQRDYDFDEIERLEYEKNRRENLSPDEAETK